MFFRKTASMCLAAAALSVSGYAQTPQAPQAPQAPRGPRVRSAGGRMLAAKRGWLGVGVVEVTQERARALKLKDESGVEVTHVEENSPAAKAGLKEHDVILEVNTQKVNDSEEFVRIIGESAPGSKVTLAVWRNGSRQSVTAALEARPVQFLTFNGPNGDWVAPMPPMPPSPMWEGTPFMTGNAPRVGFEGETLTPQLAEFFGVKEGVLVRTVSEKTPAAKAGLKAGDIIVKVSGTPVSSTREISGLIRATRKNVTFTVYRNHKEVLLNVEIAEDRVPSPDREVL
ncbi:MAG: serine protease Do [Bryobacterales bacterium]|nr:serine protease Do [Bryobacterales bacterium]